MKCLYVVNEEYNYSFAASDILIKLLYLQTVGGSLCKAMI